VLQQFEAAATLNNLLLLDCCRDNPYQSMLRGGSRGLARVADNPRGTLISYATGPNKVAADGDGENSPYTEALLEHLAISGRTAFDTLCKVNNSVAEKTANQQVPWIESNLRDNFSIIPDGSSAKKVKGATDDVVVKRVVEKDDAPKTVSSAPRNEPTTIHDKPDREVFIIDDEPKSDEPNLVVPNPVVPNPVVIDAEVVDAEVVEPELDVPAPEIAPAQIDLTRDPWCRIPTSFQQRLIDRLGSTTTVICGHAQYERQKSQVAKWIRLGCISREIVMDGGWARLQVVPHALMDSGQTKAVRRILEDQRATEDLVMSQSHEALAAWLLDDDPAEAIRLVCSWLESVIELEYEFDEEEITGHWLLCQLDAHDTSLQFLDRCDERLESSCQTVHVATILKRLHGDDQSARQKLIDIDAEDFLGTEVGEAWNDLLDDQ
jgi:hypothetical protein